MRDGTEPFNPNNKKHTQTLARWIKRIVKKYGKTEPRYLVLPKELFDEIKQRGSCDPLKQRI